MGSTLAATLISDGQVIGFGHDTHFNLLKQRINKNMQLVKGDIIDKELLKRYIKDVDVVVHTAGVVGNNACVKDSWLALRANIRGTRVLIEALQEVFQNKPPQFIFISSQAVYGTFVKRPMPLKEEMELWPDDFYGEMKAEAEWLVRQIPAVILRPTNLYGQGIISRGKNVVGKFCKLAREGNNFTLYGDGSQAVDFVHVRDVAAIVQNLIKQNIQDRIYNIGEGKATSLKELAELVVKLSQEVLSKEIEIVYQEAPPGKIWPSRWVDIEQVKKVVPDFPMTSLEQGVKELLLN